MTLAQQQAMEQAYAAGNHAEARRLARALLTQPDGAESHGRARAILVETSPDWFLAGVGALGLGLMAWLVYNYVL